MPANISISEKGDCVFEQLQKKTPPSKPPVQSIAMLRYMQTSDWVESHVLLRKKSIYAIFIIIIIIIIITTMPFVVLPQE